MSAKIKMIVFAAVVTAVITALVIHSKIPEWEFEREREQIYQTGVTYLDEGKYSEAYNEFCKLVYYKDGDNLKNLALGMSHFENSSPKAWGWLCHVDVDETVLHYVPDFDEKKAQAKEIYDRYIQNKIAEDEAEFIKSGGVPYIGMEESKISRTSLGEPTNIYENFNIAHLADGRKVSTTKYEWIKDGYIIFTVRCYYDAVRDVWDDRANPKKPDD